VSVISTRAAWFALAAAVIVLDQVTKAWVLAALTLHETVRVLPFFNLVLVHNPGAAFSFLAGAGGWQRWFFTILSVVIAGAIAAWLARTGWRRPGLATALALVLGGALGNLVDRLRFGYVVDFLDVHAAGWHWPAFNVADSAISCGAVLLVLLSLLGRE